MNFNCRESISTVSPEPMAEVGATFDRCIQRLDAIIKLIKSGEMGQDELETAHREGLVLLEQAKQAQTKLTCSSTYYLRDHANSQFSKWDAILVGELEEQLAEAYDNQIAKNY